MSFPNPFGFAGHRVPSVSSSRRGKTAWAIAMLLGLAIPSAHADLPSFLQHVIGASSIESALFRVMHLPQADALYPRPPKEATQQFATLINQAPADASLYALRARAEEESLDLTAAEADWKTYAAHASDPVTGALELADFYHRRMDASQEIAALQQAAAAPSVPAERFVNPAEQRSWTALDRTLALEADQGLPPNATYEAFLRRYPAQPALYSRFFRTLLQQKDFNAAASLIGRYHQAFPTDPVFPITAEALLEYHRGDTAQALAVYDRAFDPLWPLPLVQSYYTLLAQTHQQRIFLAAAEDRLAHNPDDLNALARIFFYHQQQGQTAAALAALDRFRLSKESRSAHWSPLELYTLATLAAQVPSWPEAARYNFALTALPGSLPTAEPAAQQAQPAAQAGLAGLIHILLAAPDQPIALGAGNLTLYRDIATLDQGPGYWNGILSLWLNGQSPAFEYRAESEKAQPYFHRAKAAELLAQLDHDFPQAPQRPALHAELLRAAASYGDPAPTIEQGKRFLADFPTSPDRVDVANLVADAYGRQKNTAAEFALYDSLLAELAARSEGQPLTAAAGASPTLLPADEPRAQSFGVGIFQPGTQPGVYAVASTQPGVYTAAELQAAGQRGAPPSSLALELPGQPIIRPDAQAIQASTQYAQLLDRYLARLSAAKQLPQALAVLRAQLDRSPDDPRLYERLAQFLSQNNLSADEEQTYRLALDHFRGRNGQDPSWYNRLAAFYLRQKRRQDFATLTRQVTDIFAGTELDRWFAQVHPNSAALGPQLALQLNLYAAKRFPHDLVFTRNLLTAYTSKPTANLAAWNALIRRHWWESPDLRDRFFESLSRTNKLDAELAQLQASPASADANPAATRELAEAQIWSSHFEQSAPLLGTLADLYPSDPDLGDRAVSLFRSLAYLDPTPASTTRAVAIETHLLTATPDNPNRIATLGDLYAEATSTGGEDLASAAPYWRRIPTLHPGSPAGYLTSATVFWDYFQFDSALAEIARARSSFHLPALFGYEAGAIQESRHDLPAAIREYTAVVTSPIDPAVLPPTVAAFVRAFVEPPSDAADSNFQATGQSLLGSAAAQLRLLQLARRPATATLVDQASAQAVADWPSSTALTLRADVLAAQHHESQLAPTLEAALNRVQTPAAAAALGTLARSHSLIPVYEHALIRQAALTQDPVEKIELKLALARSLEDRNDLPGATSVMEDTYRANPRLLGVVRATVDFDSRTHQPARAIATLLEAAKAATPDLANAFTLEAAQKANDAGETAQARTLALTLLEKSPYDPRYLAAAAQSYARANDNAGLRQFYLARLDQVRTAPLPQDERKSATALLRRGLIPALTRLNDFDGAVAQYIALLSAYPEDAATAQQAALYALQHSRQPQLLDFLRTTVQASPRDSRFVILLAQTQSTFGNLPAALAAYSQAIAIRKDRVDLYTAHADLALRLDQPDIAAADYDRLYLLTYKDPAWMLRLAELRARQQRPADSVKALETAYITGRPANPRNEFLVAGHLADWNLLPQARTFAEQGIALAGKDLLINSTLTAAPESDDSSDTTADTATDSAAPSAPILSVTSTPSGASTYARILARSGEPGQALTTLLAARRAASSPAPVLLAAMTHGLSPKDAAAAVADYIQRRQQALDQSFTAALTTLGTAVQTYSTPEQELPFAQAILQHQSDPQPAPYIAAAHAAGLAEVESTLLKQALLAPGNTGQYLTPYTTLQTSRLRFAELAQTLEAYEQKLKPEVRPAILQQASEAYHSAGDEASELRLAHVLVATQATDHFLDLLLRHDPAALATFASSSNPSLADAAANFALIHASEPQTLAVLKARAAAPDIVQGPDKALWLPAYTALTGLSYASTPSAPAQAKLVDTAFRQLLTPEATIAARLASPADPTHQLTGALWFPYASSYALFRQSTPSTGDPEDLLAASLEADPASPTPYLTLARTYAEAHNTPAALTEYAHALELSPGSPSILDEQATYLLRLNQTAPALAAWHSALATLQSDAEKNSFPATFWTDFDSITTHLAQNHLASQFRPDLLAILRPYLAHNGTYRSNELLKSAFESASSAAQGLSLLLASVADVPNESGVLSDLQSAPWLSPDDRATLLQRRIDVARATPNSSLVYLQLQLVRLDLDRNALPAAQAVLNAILPQSSPDSLQPLRIELATRTNALPALIVSWTSSPDSIPTSADLQSALTSLQRPTPAYKPIPTQILPLQEFAFEQKRLTATLLPTDYLALASLRLQTNDLPGALDLLHRLALQPPTPTPTYALAIYSPDDLASEDTTSDPYANLDSAARLLETTHHPAEAIPFLQTLTRNEPWNASYRLRFAQAQLASPEKSQAQATLLSVAKDASAPYATRVHAAQLLAPLHPAAPSLGSAELNLLATASTAPVTQPYFAAARAISTQPAQLAESIAIDPTGPINATARLALLRAQLAQGPPSAALATLASFSNTPAPSNSGAETSDAADQPPTEALPAVYLPAPIQALDSATRASLALQIASAYEREGALASAIPYLQLAASLNPSDPSPSHHIAELRTSLALAALNAARRPIVHKALEQTPAQTPTQASDQTSADDAQEPRTVRPRLLTLPPVSLEAQ